MSLYSLNEPVKHLFDAASIGTTILALLQVIPHVTAVLSLIWVCLRIYEWFVNKSWRPRA